MRPVDVRASQLCFAIASLFSSTTLAQAPASTDTGAAIAFAPAETGGVLRTPGMPEQTAPQAPAAAPQTRLAGRDALAASDALGLPPSAPVDVGMSTPPAGAVSPASSGVLQTALPGRPAPASPAREAKPAPTPPDTPGQAPVIDARQALFPSDANASGAGFDHALNLVSRATSAPDRKIAHAAAPAIVASKNHAGAAVASTTASIAAKAQPARLLSDAEISAATVTIVQVLALNRLPEVQDIAAELIQTRREQLFWSDTHVDAAVARMQEVFGQDGASDNREAQRREDDTPTTTGAQNGGPALSSTAAEENGTAAAANKSSGAVSGNASGTVPNGISAATPLQDRLPVPENPHPPILLAVPALTQREPVAAPQPAAASSLVDADPPHPPAQPGLLAQEDGGVETTDVVAAVAGDVAIETVFAAEAAVALADEAAADGAVAGQVVAQPAGEADTRKAFMPFGDGVLLAASESTLENMRGGFDNGAGLQVSFGISRVAYINGNLATTTSFTIPDVGKITNDQARQISAQLGNANLVQNGAGNHFQANLSGTPGLVIQNSLNDQNIQTRTVIDASANSAGMLRNMNLQRTLNEALGSGLRR